MSPLDNPLLDTNGLSLSLRVHYVIRILFENVKSFLLPEPLCHDWSSGTLQSPLNSFILIISSMVCSCLIYKQMKLSNMFGNLQRFVRNEKINLTENELLLMSITIAYFPISNVIPVGFVRAERCLYTILPMYAWLLSNGQNKVFHALSAIPFRGSTVRRAPRWLHWR